MLVRTLSFRVQLTDLDDGIRVRHVVDVSRREVLLSLGSDRLVRRRNLFPKSVLDLGPPRELPQCEFQLKNQGYRMSSRGT
jgi:hypothetical protein